MQKRRITNYENYTISDTGIVTNEDTNKVLKPKMNYGYLLVTLSKKGRCKTFRVHRLVAEAFIPNPDNLPVIDHIDTDRTNNNISNLRWCTAKENIANPITRDKMKSVYETQRKPVVGISIKDNSIIQFDSLTSAGLNGFDPRTITKVIKGKQGRSQHKGYKWYYLSDYVSNIKKSNENKADIN